MTGIILFDSGKQNGAGIVWGKKGGCVWGGGGGEALGEPPGHPLASHWDTLCLCTDHSRLEALKSENHSQRFGKNTFGMYA